MNNTTTEDFKSKCFQILRYTPYIERLIKAFDSDSVTEIRYVLEDALDDEDLYVKDELTDSGERIIANGKIFAFKARREIYSEFIQMLVDYIDAHTVGDLVKIEDNDSINRR